MDRILSRKIGIIIITEEGKENKMNEEKIKTLKQRNRILSNWKNLKKSSRGITLIALVITVIVLLILAAVSIATLTGENGILTRASDAREQTIIGQEKEQVEIAYLGADMNKTGESVTVKELQEELDKVAKTQVSDNEDGTFNVFFTDTEHNYNVNNGKIEEVVINWIQNADGSITNKDKTITLQIGQYVDYNPTAVLQTDSSYTQLISMLGEETSGSTSNTSTTITQESLNWRILDVENGKIRLISDKPTDSKIELNNYQGYNNGVYLIDKACKVLYSNSTLASTVQNLKLEDIEKYLVTKPTYDTTLYSPPTYNYPSILEQEEGQTIDGITQPSTRLGKSEQYELANPNSKKVATSWTLKNTATSTDMNESMFLNSIYYDLFLNSGVYWLSTRCVYVSSTGTFADYAQFGFKIGGSRIFNTYFYNSNDRVGRTSLRQSLRPVITLNANIQITSGSGTEDDAYTIEI